MRRLMTAHRIRCAATHAILSSAFCKRQLPVVGWLSLDNRCSKNAEALAVDDDLHALRTVKCAAYDRDALSVEGRDRGKIVSHNPAPQN